MKNLLLIIFNILLCFFVYLLIFIIISKIGVYNTFKLYWAPICTIITSIGLIAVPFILYLSGKKYNKNKLTTEIIQEYYYKDMNEAIRGITDFINDLGCRIEKNEITKADKKKVEIIKKYKELYGKGEAGLTIKKNKIYKWKDIDFYRRYIANYFVKIKLLYENKLINKKLVKQYWSDISLIFLREYIITLEYLALPIIHDGNIEDSTKGEHLFTFYNYFVDKRNKNMKIGKEELLRIYKCYKCK